MKQIFLLISLLFSFHVFAQENIMDIISGRSEIGETCTSDYECSTLCCDQAVGLCARHDNDIQCNKASGQKCVTSEFCKSEYVAVCNIYKLGIGADGKVTCAMRCPATKVSSSCVSGICRAPRVPPVPPFDPSDCSTAIDP